LDHKNFGGEEQVLSDRNALMNTTNKWQDHKQQKMTKGSKTTRGACLVHLKNTSRMTCTTKRPMSFRAVVVFASPCTTEVDKREQDHNDHKALQLESTEIQNEEGRQW